MRQFNGGATRDTTEVRFLSPEVLTQYCQYLEKHRETAAGRRDQDNWKSGIPVDVYVDSLGRHFWEIWSAWERDEEIPMDAVYAVMFNAMGIVYEEARGR